GRRLHGWLNGRAGAGIEPSSDGKCDGAPPMGTGPLQLGPGRSTLWSPVRRAHPTMTSRFLPSLLTTALAAALLAACAPESPSTSVQLADAPPAPVDVVIDAGQAVAVAAGMQSDESRAAPALARSGDAIAAYPNRGDLVGYDHVRLPERRGAHTFYPARVSEAHALEAIGTGTLYLTGPDGDRVALQYERHVEHPSGDWSWIGRDENGIEGILTFGEQAVFGVVPYGEGDSLRLTTSAGQTWLAT